MAFDVDVNRVGGYFETPGGEFTINAVNPLDPTFVQILSQYDASTIVNGGFQTFCLSEDTALLGNPQTATLSTSVVAAGTAWLYAQFVNQTLPGYNYTPGAGRISSAFALQNAIWSLQGLNNVDPAAGAAYFNLAVAHFGSVAAATAPNNGGFGVDALDLNDLAGAISQPMLALVPQSTGTPLEHGDTATIGFWHNKNGQALIECVNGGPTSTALGDWLGSNFGCLFGSLNGAPNAAVAAQFLTYFGVQGEKTYAQIMGAALACYVTSSTLAGGDCASVYGFNVSVAGTGAKLFNVGSNGSAIGLSNNTSYTILQLLEAANANCSGGIISPTAFDALNNIFDDVNSTGDIK